MGGVGAGGGGGAKSDLSKVAIAGLLGSLGLVTAGWRLRKFEL